MKLDTQWVTGFVDGEGCFYVGINAHSEMTAGFQVLPEFTVVQHKRDVQVLHALKAFFGCGVVRTNHGDRMAAPFILDARSTTGLAGPPQQSTRQA